MHQNCKKVVQIVQKKSRYKLHSKCTTSLQKVHKVFRNYELQQQIITERSPNWPYCFQSKDDLFQRSNKNAKKNAPKVSQQFIVLND